LVITYLYYMPLGNVNVITQHKFLIFQFGQKLKNNVYGLNT